MEPKSFGLSLLQCYSDDENSNSGNDNETNLISFTKDRSNFDMEYVVNVPCLGAVDTIEEKDGKLAVIVDLLPSLETQSLPLHTIQRPVVEFPLNYRVNYKSSESESESSSDESCLTVPVGLDLNASVEDDENNAGISKREVASLNSKSKMLEDLGIFDLAPLEDLKISVPEEECIPIGVVHKIIDPLVIVSARKGCPALDLDSVLFLDHGKTFLGQVFDVFGQVSEPMYMVRFNSLQHIIEQGIQIGMEVFFAPRTRHTAFVFVDSLFQHKGSDASWENDQEPPEGCLDYSDDEQERRAKAAHRLKKNPRNNTEDASANPCKKRHTKYGGTKGKEHVNEQPQVNPFYMLPPPCYPPSNSNSSSLTSSLIPVASNISTTENSEIPSPYVYPPTIPPAQSLPVPLLSDKAENNSDNKVSSSQPDNSIQMPPIL